VASDFALRASARQGPTSLCELRRDKKTYRRSGARAQGSPINRDLRFATTGKDQGSPINRDFRFTPTGKDQGPGAETEEKRKEERAKSKGQGSSLRSYELWFGKHGSGDKVAFTCINKSDCLALLLTVPVIN